MANGKKSKSGIVLGVAAVLGIGIIFSPEKPKDDDTAGITETAVITTTEAYVDEDYIDVNAELDDISGRRKPKETSGTTVKETSQTTDKTTKKTAEKTTAETTEAETKATDSADGGAGNAGFNSYDEPEQQNTVEYVLNTSTMKFHKPSCSSVKKIKPENYATIDSRDKAINSGYEPCGKCHP